jgi:hypothetical protein
LFGGTLEDSWPGPCRQASNIEARNSTAGSAIERRSNLIQIVISQVQQEMARSAEMPQDRVTALQDAFAAVMHDPRYVDEAQKQLHENEPVGAARVTEIVQKMTSAPREILDAFRDAAMKTDLVAKP